MKKLSVFLAAAFLCMPSFAQEENGYVQSKKDSRARYGIYYSDKLRGYVERNVTDVKEEGNKLEVTHLYTVLNKKGKPSKMAALGGFGDGLQTAITVEDGAYYLTFDCMMGTTGEDRSGYLLKLPKTLKVGDEVEGGTLKSTTKFLGSTAKNEITFKDFKVTEETDLNTPAGTFHCLKLTGTVTGRYVRDNVNEIQTLYLAPGIGIVRQESLNYMGSKVSFVLELTEVGGL